MKTYLYSDGYNKALYKYRKQRDDLVVIEIQDQGFSPAQISREHLKELMKTGQAKVYGLKLSRDGKLIKDKNT